MESRLVRFGALLAGLSVVGSLLVGCQPSSPDEGWGIQQLALDAEYEPRVSMPVTVSADGQSIGFTVWMTVSRPIGRSVYRRSSQSTTARVAPGCWQ